MLKRSLIQIIILLGGIMQGAWAQFPCTVTYIANEGFLVQTENHKIMIDALFGNIRGDWCAQPSDSIAELMFNGCSPFDMVDVVLVTHKHVDHFNESMMTKFLMKNPKSVLICPDQVNELMKQNASYGRISGQVHSLKSKIPFDTTLALNGIKIRVLRLNHGSYFETDSTTGKQFDRHSSIENFAYLIETDGFTLFHSGDGSALGKELFKSYGFGSREIDIVFLDRIFLGREGQELMRETINARTIVFMHIEPKRAEYFKSVVKSVPHMHVFTRLMEQKAFPKQITSGDTGSISHKQHESRKLFGLYLGQQPPEQGSTLFAPGFVSTEYGELNSLFTQDGREFYFSRRGIPGKKSMIMGTEMKRDEWTTPAPVPFTGKFSDIDLFLMDDGKSMVFCSNRPHQQGGATKRDHDFWIAKREGERWSEPVLFAKEALSESEDYYPVVTRSGNLYFNSQRGGPGTNDIFCSKYVADHYSASEKLPAPINTEYREFDAFVSQEENLMLFSSEKPDGLGRSDIYVSFKTAGGPWSEPKNLGKEINSEYSEYGATLSHDGNYIFFTSNRNGSEDIFWNSAKCIEELRPKK